MVFVFHIELLCFSFPLLYIQRHIVRIITIDVLWGAMRSKVRPLSNYILEIAAIIACVCTIIGLCEN